MHGTLYMEKKMLLGVLILMIIKLKRHKCKTLKWSRNTCDELRDGISISDVGGTHVA